MRSDTETLLDALRSGDEAAFRELVVRRRGRRVVPPPSLRTAPGGPPTSPPERRRAADLAAGAPPGLADLMEGYAGDAARYAAAGDPAVAAYVTAIAAGDAAAGRRVQDGDSPAARAERTRQGAWMVEHLGL